MKYIKSFKEITADLRRIFKEELGFDVSVQYAGKHIKIKDYHSNSFSIVPVIILTEKYVRESLYSVIQVCYIEKRELGFHFDFLIIPRRKGLFIRNVIGLIDKEE